MDHKTNFDKTIVKQKDTHDMIVLELSQEKLDALVKELSDKAYTKGATLFLNIYENESKFADGEPFNSTQMFVKPYEEPTAKSNESERNSNVRKAVSKLSRRSAKPRS